MNPKKEPSQSESERRKASLGTDGRANIAAPLAAGMKKLAGSGVFSCCSWCVCGCSHEVSPWVLNWTPQTLAQTHTHTTLPKSRGRMTIFKSTSFHDTPLVCLKAEDGRLLCQALTVLPPFLTAAKCATNPSEWQRPSLTRPRMVRGRPAHLRPQFSQAGCHEKPNRSKLLRTCA